MVMMGLGMGLISTPATESILLVLPPARAGVGSAVNDATRELGGTLGVAVVGLDLLQRVRRRPRRRAHGASAGPAFAQAEESVGAGAALATSAELSAAFESAFLAGLEVSCVVVGIVCLVGAVAAAIALPGRIRTEGRRRGAGARRRLTRSRDGRRLRDGATS